jgi:hypothetical protein
LQELPAYCRDLATVVIGKPPVNFVHKSKVASVATRSSSNGHTNGSVQLQKQQPGDVVDELPVASRTDVPTQWN